MVAQEFVVVKDDKSVVLCILGVSLLVKAVSVLVGLIVGMICDHSCDGLDTLE